MKKKDIRLLFIAVCCAIGAATGLTACTDHFDLDALHNTSRLVVYCFPSQADTTYISVSNSVGVSKATDTRKANLLRDARVSYSVNGQPRPVQQLADGTCFVTGGHQAGDRVTLLAEHDGYGSAEASTTVPQATAVELRQVRTITEYDASWGDTREFCQIAATFTDPAESTDYYAVRVGISSDETTAPTSLWATISVGDEPLLNRLSAIDEDFGFENNFYQDIYFFTDKDINGRQYTLHLNIATSQLPHRRDNPRLQVVLYRLTPDYYLYLKSINDIENNELAQGGFAQLTPVYCNVSGGLGLVGAYWAAHSEWMSAYDDNNNDPEQ